MTRARTLGCILLALASAAGRSWGEEPGTYSPWLEQGRELARLRDYAGAYGVLSKALLQGRSEGPTAEANALMALGEVMMEHAEWAPHSRFGGPPGEPPGPEAVWTRPMLLEGAQGYFEETLRLTTGPELERLRVKAANGLALVLLDRGQAKRAVETLEEVADLVDAEQEPRFLYNYGVALTRSGRPKEGITALLSAARREPDFAASFERARAVAKRERLAEEAVVLVELAIDEGKTDLAERMLKGFLAERTFRDRPEFDRLVGQLARLFVAQDLDREEFAQQWERWLRKLARRLEGSRAERLRTFDVAYREDLPAASVFEPLFAAWSESDEGRGHFSALLARIASRSYRAGEPSAAFVRFGQAWVLEPDDLAPLQYLLNIIIRRGADLGAGSELVWGVLERLREVPAGNGISGGSQRAFYLLLGDALRGSGRPDGREAAVGAWESALQAGAGADPPSVSRGTSALLHGRLAVEYAHLGEGGLACGHLAALAEVGPLPDRELESAVEEVRLGLECRGQTSAVGSPQPGERG